VTFASHIVAMGGGDLGRDTDIFKLERYILDITGKSAPRVCFVPTASGDDASYVVRFYHAYARFGVGMDVLRFFYRAPADLRAFLFEFDVVHVGGGNTRSMLATWRHWGFDAVLREAWERGIVLCGSSAGSICWFESGVTDSVAGSLTAMDALGFIGGSNCPHYDGEAERRPSYERMIATGVLPDGIACDDGAGAHFVGRSLHAAIAARPNARAFRVARDGTRAVETPLDLVRVS